MKIKFIVFWNFVQKSEIQTKQIFAIPLFILFLLKLLVFFFSLFLLSLLLLSFFVCFVLFFKRWFSDFSKGVKKSNKHTYSQEVTALIFKHVVVIQFNLWNETSLFVELFVTGLLSGLYLYNHLTCITFIDTCVVLHIYGVGIITFVFCFLFAKVFDR